MTYWLLLITFLCFPIIGIILSNNKHLEKLSKYRNWIIFFFLIHNILFYFGLSLKGDYVDYIIFSFEYLIICLTIFSLKGQTNWIYRGLKTVGFIGIIFGFFFGLVGILFFIVLTMDLETDKVFRYTCKDKSYETRRYSFGFATLDNTRYTFETYRTLNVIPLEYKIDKSDFFDDKTKLNIAEDELKIDINADKKSLTFISTNGNTFTKTIK